MSDPRFARLRTDPRFRRPKHKQNKVVVDERFKSVFDQGKSKKSAGRVDKYGRSISQSQERDNLRRFYRLENEDGEEPEHKTVDYARGEVLLESSDEEEGSANDESGDDGIVTLGLDQSRPIPISRDEDEIDLDEDNFADLDTQAAASLAAARDEESEPVAQPTRRIAAVNLDWDHIRANHLYKIFSSLFTPTTIGKHQRAAPSASARGKVTGVRVYPSEFGKERIAREEREGPPTEVFKKKREVEDEDEVNETNVYDVGEEDEVDEDALRKYQLERLRYYYAIIEFDTIEAAEHAFNELEGTELERSANVFDLSYVPDDMGFDDDPRDEATTEANVPYKGLDFVTDALRHSKVKLTWDEDDPERNRITRRALSKKEIEEADFKALIASSESESESEPVPSSAKASSSPRKSKREAERERMRELLLGGGAGSNELPEGWHTEDAFDEKAKGESVDMEITFMPGLSERKDAGENETTLEAYRRKMREKRKQRKSETKERSRDDEGEGSMPSTSSAAPKDDFFGSDAEGDDNGMDARVQKGKKVNDKVKADKATRKPEQKDAPRKVSTAEELSLLAISDNVNSEPKHFDMKAVLKSEKKKGKKLKKKNREDEPDETQEGFTIDVKDERFKALHEDHTFAIDPSNPHFKKTKSMTALLDERAKRRKSRASEDSRGVGHRTSDAPGVEGEGTDRALQKLVESVKRKSGVLQEGRSSGKRQKT